MKLTLSVRSFQTPDTPRTCAWPPSLPSVPTSRATRVTSSANADSWSTIVLMVSLSWRISPCASTVIFLLRSPLATAVATCAMLRTCTVRLLAIPFTESVRSFQTPDTPRTCAWPPRLPSVPTSRATRVTSSANADSWSTIVFTVCLSCSISPCASTVTLRVRSPRATAVVMSAMSRTWAALSVTSDVSEASWLPTSSASKPISASMSLSAWPVSPRSPCLGRGRKSPARNAARVARIGSRSASLYRGVRSSPRAPPAPFAFCRTVLPRAPLAAAAPSSPALPFAPRVLLATVTREVAVARVIACPPQPRLACPVLGPAGPDYAICDVPTSRVCHDGTLNSPQMPPNVTVRTERTGHVDLVAAATYDPESAAVPAARRFVRETLRSWQVLGCDDLLADAELLTSELVTNAVLHAETPVRVICRADGSEVEVSVLDRQPGRTIPGGPGRTADSHREAGRGLVMLAALSSSWGVTYAPAAKAVWFRLRPGSAGPADPDVYVATATGTGDGFGQAGPRSFAATAAATARSDADLLRLGYQELLNHTAGLARDTARADAAYVLIADEDGVLRIRAAAGLSAPYARGAQPARLPAARQAATQEWASSRPSMTTWLRTGPMARRLRPERRNRS